jgi:non-homologous end joining protein Ku
LVAVRDLSTRKKEDENLTTAAPVKRDGGKVVDLRNALRRSLETRGGAKERAERFRERKKAKSAAKPKTAKRSA